MRFGDQAGLAVGDVVIVAPGGRNASPVRRRLDHEPARIIDFVGPPDEHGHARATLATCGLQPIVPVCELTPDT